MRPGGAGSSRVRPYAITGGRTRVGRDLNVETLVSAVDGPVERRLRTRPELRAICEMCRSARSVAEVSALLEVPLGVAKVLIGDLVEQGRLRVHGAERDEETGSPDQALLERVLGGLRRL